MHDPNEFEQLVVAAEAALAEATAPAQRARLATEYLGRNGKLTALLKDIKDLDEEGRRKAGIAGNAAKARLEQLFDAAKNESAARPAQPVDVTLPGASYEFGHYHPITIVLRELVEVFMGLGFSVVEGPEVEDDWHNFEALNMPADHPARDMQDTFYLAGSEDTSGRFRLLPRTHTSGVQIRTMEASKPPVRVISPGMVFRNEAEDATHLAAFSQLEGLMVDKNITFGDLKGVLSHVAKKMIGPDAKLRFRPSYFPYTEPSAEIDVSAPAVRGGEWIELGGCGMVHPNVLRNVGWDPKEYRGFAFGPGLARIAMLRYGIDDIRRLAVPDVRLLEQF